MAKKSGLIAIALLIAVTAGLFVARSWPHSNQSGKKSPTNSRPATKQVKKENPKPDLPVPPPVKTEDVIWPFYGYDIRRSHSLHGPFPRHPSSLRCSFSAKGLLEFPPVFGYGKMYLANSAPNTIMAMPGIISAKKSVKR